MQNNIFDHQEIIKKLEELNSLKEKVDHLYKLNNIGNDIRLELEEYKILKSKGVNIEHLDRQFSSQLYPRRIIGKVKNPIYLTESAIKEAFEKSPSAIKAARRLGISYPTLKRYARRYGIHTTKGFPIKKGEKRGPINPFLGRYPITEILEGKHPNFPIHRLKDKLIRSGTKKPECEQCGFSERRSTDGKLPLLLNFEDNNNKNHKLENMRLLCYNCTFNCGKGYITRGPNVFDPDMLQDSKKILKQRF